MVKSLKRYFLLCLLVTFIGLFTACNKTTLSNHGGNLNEPANIAKAYLVGQGYTILSHEHSADPYILTKQLLIEFPYMQTWQKQLVNPADYLGREIYGESFNIQNHPLDNWESGSTQALGKTHVYVMIVDGEVIGGTAAPVTNESLYGAPWSLDGKTFEELYPNVNWRTWADNWIATYSE